MVKINIFRGELSDMSSKTVTLACIGHFFFKALHRSFKIVTLHVRFLNTYKSYLAF